jgi:5-methyltetrahydropteroyltriglutamate--homocysteine methyltransferase
VKRSTNRTLTTHAGSLPRPEDLLELYREDVPEAKLLPRLQSTIADVVKRQADIGIDIVNDGEFGKAMSRAVDFAAWWSYVYDRLAGFEIRKENAKMGRAVYSFGSKDRKDFAEFYAQDGGMAGSKPSPIFGLICTGPVKYVGQQAVRRDIDLLKSGLRGVSTEDAFITAVSPATLQILPNEHYGSQEDYTWALAEAIREEYKTIVDAGFILQIDDPALVDIWDLWFSLKGDMAAYRKWAEFQVEAVNHALQGIPEDRVRFHICWGSWHGPHSGDIPLSEIVDLLLRVKAQAYSVEAGNVRHELEWKVWEQTKLPDGKLLIPGVVSHATNLIEPPELVADRIFRFAKIVGRENIIAGTDCGLGGRVHQQIAWAKLAALSEGARLASKELWH